MQTHGLWPGPPAEPRAPASSPSWSEGPRWGKNVLEVWGGEFTNTRNHGAQILHRPGFASLDDLKRGPYLGDEEICPQPALFLPPTPHQPRTRQEPSQEAEGVTFSSPASIRIENDASGEETFLLGPLLTKIYLLGERELGYFNYSTYAQGILRGIYRLLLTICILRLLLRHDSCFRMKV